MGKRKSESESEERQEVGKGREGESERVEIVEDVGRLKSELGD